MITATVIGIVMLVVVIVMMLGLMSAVISIALMYTGRSKSYDRAAAKIDRANAAPKAKKEKKVKESN
ncbi:MAG: hypothetical protein MJ129_03085 [Clostridia bacterium]|nr:hypothetical protein [Clostridia bacterium]